MIPAARQKRILELINNQQIMSIAQLVEEIGVSHMTIRRDIKALEAMGQVVPVSGGVQLIERVIEEPTHDDKSFLNQEQKAAIGLKAAEYVPSRGTVFLDSGTTTREIARHIKNNEDLLVVTNDFEIARWLMRHGRCKLMHTGGTVNKDSYSAVGELAARFIKNISIDVAFVSTSAWSSEGITTPDESKIIVKNAIIKSARSKILVVDSSKYGKIATFNVSDLSVFNLIISDKNLQKKSQDMIDKRGISISLV
ncbi:DeoR family transcriptional regulator [Psittacicella melopsittaci]|uniref:DeoR family transcriptional regulator n=1 Tax=Psittacicella melopsittaci TaxID=2028576 RepID=A0A3A1Y9N2_9GAMM|nr:DeoR/GlpR family DNA-binding transcription regulator [Psittacicella melopsittaci]RIY33929.1 DeoR family transcriptional regulator [Psittacicella melopsittaci]